MKTINLFITLVCVPLAAYCQLNVPGGTASGITNNSPATHLEYKASNLWNGTIRANGTGYSSFALYESDALRWAIYNHPGVSNALLFANAQGQDKLALTQAGNFGVDNISPQVKLDLGNAQASGLQFRYDQSASYRIRLSPYWNSSTDTRLDFNIERVGNSGFETVMSVGYAGKVGIGMVAPVFKLDVEGNGARVKNSSASSGAYTTFRMQGPNYDQGLEIDFFGNNNITSDPNWSYGGGPGSAAIVNFNAKPLVFGTNNQGRMLIDGNGNVGIGTTNPGSFKLAVEGKIGAREVNVMLTNPWPDYVFDDGYELLSLSALAQYVARHKHLPEVPTAGEVEQNGVSLGEMNSILLKKMEELTLYVLELKKENDEARAAMRIMEAKINLLQTRK